MRSRISTWIPAFIAFAISSKNVKKINEMMGAPFISFYGTL